MNPKPFSPLNHFTLPCAMLLSPYGCSQTLTLRTLGQPSPLIIPRLSPTRWSGLPALAVLGFQTEHREQTATVLGIGGVAGDRPGCPLVLDRAVGLLDRACLAEPARCRSGTLVSCQG